MLRGRPLRSGGDGIGWRSIPQALVFLGHDDSCILSADLIEVNALSHHLDPIRIFEFSDLEELWINCTNGDFRLCHIFGFGGLVDRGLDLCSERTCAGDATDNLRFSRACFRIQFVACCTGMRMLEGPWP